MQIDKKKIMLSLMLSIIGIWIALFGVILFQQNLLMLFPLPLRAILMIFLQWVPAIPPIIIMLISKDKIDSLGFTTKRFLCQIWIGVAIAFITSLFLTIIPILFGLKDYIGSTSYTKPWQFLYEFIYCIFGVAFSEELVFRGFIFHRLLQLKNNRIFATVISSVLFGLCHIFVGNIMQICMTALLGAFYCLCREKIKDCSTLSLIVAHGIYDALIVLWVFIL